MGRSRSSVTNWGCNRRSSTAGKRSSSVNGAAAFQAKGRADHQAEQDRIEFLEKKIQRKGEVLAEQSALGSIRQLQMPALLHRNCLSAPTPQPLRSRPLRGKRRIPISNVLAASFGATFNCGVHIPIIDKMHSYTAGPRRF